MSKAITCLKVVALLSLHPQLVALNLNLNLQLAVSHRLGQFLGGVLGDPLVESKRRLEAAASYLLGDTATERLQRHLAAYEFLLEHVDGGLETIDRLRIPPRSSSVGESDRGVGTAKVVSVRQLASGLVDRIRNLLRIYF